MLEDLQSLSEDYARETREVTSRGYSGSMLQGSYLGLSDIVAGAPYRESQIIRRRDQDVVMGDPYTLKSRYAAQPMSQLMSAYPSTATSYPDKYRHPPRRGPEIPSRGRQLFDNLIRSWKPGIIARF